MPSKRTPLLSRLLGLRVPARGLAVARLGQSGFALKTPAGKLVALDPYLTDSCAALGRKAGVDMRRLVPPPLSPTDLARFDLIAFTHSHQDHFDPATIRGYLKAGGRATLLAPHDTAPKLASLGVPDNQLEVIWPNRLFVAGDFRIKATLAIPLGPDDLNHVGYLCESERGPRIYFTGDTDYNDILHLQVAPYAPDILATVINPAFRNLGPDDAARLAGKIRPRWVVPCHHDLFPDNSLPDRLLRTNLLQLRLESSFCPLGHGELRVFENRKARAALA